MVQKETEKDVIYFQDNLDYNLFFSVKTYVIGRSKLFIDKICFKWMYLDSN